MPSGNQAGWAQWCYHAMSLVTEEGSIGHRVLQDPLLEGAHRDQQTGEAEAPRTHNVWGRCGGHRQCECSKMVDFIDTLVLYRLVSGIYEKELQKDLTLVKAEFHRVSPHDS